jgi:hypothetical protein
MLRTSQASPEPEDQEAEPAFGEPLVPLLRATGPTQVIGRPQHLPRARPAPGDLLITTSRQSRHPRVWQVVADVAWPHDQVPPELPREGEESGFYALVRPVGAGGGPVVLRRLFDGEGRLPRGQWLVRVRRRTPASLDLAGWQDLLSRGHAPARLEDASGPLVVDRFAVHIRRLPHGLPGVGSPAALFDWVRLRLHETFPRGLCRLSGETVEDEGRWRSTTPFGAILRVDLIEEQKVACATRDARHFRWLRLRSGGEADVFAAGVREWGITPVGGGFEIYTRGVERAGGWMYGRVPRAARIAGESAWRSFQEGVLRLVTDAGGDAFACEPEVHRTSWADAAIFAA